MKARVEGWGRVHSFWVLAARAGLRLARRGRASRGACWGYGQGCRASACAGSYGARPGQTRTGKETTVCTTVPFTPAPTDGRSPAAAQELYKPVADLPCLVVLCCSAVPAAGAGRGDGQRQQWHADSKSSATAQYRAGWLLTSCLLSPPCPTYACSWAWLWATRGPRCGADGFGRAHRGPLYGGLRPADCRLWAVG